MLIMTALKAIIGLLLLLQALCS